MTLKAHMQLVASEVDCKQSVKVVRKAQDISGKGWNSLGKRTARWKWKVFPQTPESIYLKQNVRMMENWKELGKLEDV